MHFINIERTKQIISSSDIEEIFNYQIKNKILIDYAIQIAEIIIEKHTKIPLYNRKIQEKYISRRIYFSYLMINNINYIKVNNNNYSTDKIIEFDSDVDISIEYEAGYIETPEYMKYIVAHIALQIYENPHNLSSIDLLILKLLLPEVV